MDEPKRRRWVELDDALIKAGCKLVDVSDQSRKRPPEQRLSLRLSTLSDLRYGRHKPSDQVIFDLARVLNCRVEDLTPREHDENHAVVQQLRREGWTVIDSRAKQNDEPEARAS